MTAEIAILNRHAVALAADSAVTLQTFGSPPKIYNTNKLFVLSKYQPVGIMIFGNAEFMDCPWEVAIKAYRAKLGQKQFPWLADYGRDFLTFIRSNSQFFPPEQQETHFYRMVANWLTRLTRHWKTKLDFELKNSSSISPKKAQSFFRDIVDEEINNLRQLKTLSGFSRLTPASIARTYRDVIHQAIKDVLQKLPTSRDIPRIELGAAIVGTKDAYWNDATGVVIAGFGTKDFFPSLRCYELASIICGRLRAKEDLERRGDVTFTDTALIHAFAQTEMVGQFMDGIDRDFQNFIINFVRGVLLKGYPDIITKVLGKHVAKRHLQQLTDKFMKSGAQLVDALAQDMMDYSRKRHSNPIVEIVNSLPKEELAAMAESLVNLTSFKRHVTRDAETVGGPIDVAVISRGDGFIWIKRKHYFQRDLNPQFFSNYYFDTGETR